MKGPLGGLEHLVGGVEPGHLHLLVAEGLGGADAGKTAFDLRVDVAGLLLDHHGDLAHIAAHGHDHHQENGDEDPHRQSQLPADGRHDDERAYNGDEGGQQVLRPVMGQFCQLKQVCRQPAHQLPCPVGIVKVIAQLLHMAKQILTNVRLHPDAEGMAEIADDIVQSCPQNINNGSGNHQPKKHPVFSVWKQIVQALPGHQRKRQVDQGNQCGAANVQGKEPLVVSEIVEKNPQRTFLPVFFRGHGYSPFSSFSASITDL